MNIDKKIFFLTFLIEKTSLFPENTEFYDIDFIY